MSGGEGEHGTSARKRKDKKKSQQRHRGTTDRGFRTGRPFDPRLIGGLDYDDDDSGDVDADHDPKDYDDGSDAEGWHSKATKATDESKSHGVGLLSAFVFVLLLGGLVGLGVLIFTGLKNSNKEVTTPIGESRYASLLSDFVDEHVTDEHGDGGEEDSHESTLLHYESGEKDDDDDDHDDDDHDHEHEHEHGDGEHVESDVEYKTSERIVDADGRSDDIVESYSAAEDTVSQSEDVDVEHAAAPIQAPDDVMMDMVVADEAVQETQENHADMVMPTTTTTTEDYVPQEEQVIPMDDEPVEQTPDQDGATMDETILSQFLDDVVTDSHQVVDDHPAPEVIQQEYANSDITNSDDFEIRAELDDADDQIDKSPETALKRFEAILATESRANSPRANYGRARSLDVLSERYKSNGLLERSIEAYQVLLSLPSEDVPDQLLMTAIERCVDRLRFRGFLMRAIELQKSLVARFPTKIVLRNELAVTYLLGGKTDLAKQTLEAVLAMSPDNGFAQVHYGFILKTVDEDYPRAIAYMMDGIHSGQSGTIDGRFFFHLGDALARLGRQQEAMDVYQEGVNRGLFLSVYQRSLYNVPSLTGRPWWSSGQLPTYEHHLRTLEHNWRTIRDEGLALLSDNRDAFVSESEGLREKGVWKQFELFARGDRNRGNCARAPKTCRLIETIPDAANCSRGQVKFSIMLPKSHVWAHTGPTNCRLRAHLGLVVPQGVRIRVANETRSWTEGRFIVFDDSFEHEVWHDGDGLRLVLIVDLWHPELKASQKRSLSPI